MIEQGRGGGRRQPQKRPRLERCQTAIECNEIEKMVAPTSGGVGQRLEHIMNIQMRRLCRRSANSDLPRPLPRDGAGSSIGRVLSYGRCEIMRLEGISCVAAGPLDGFSFGARGQSFFWAHLRVLPLWNFLSGRVFKAQS
jgi:hypothetical protein